MKSKLLAFGAGILVLVGAAHAQSWTQDPYYRTNPYDRNRDNYSYGYVGNGQYLVDRVLSDLDRAAGAARLDGHERNHFEEVARNLQEFQAKWARGRFDTGKLDKAIHNLEHLSEADRVRGRDRDMLARDVQDLRQFRATRGRYGQYPNSYPDWR